MSYLQGHEWLGGAVHFREAPTPPPPLRRNASLLLLGVLSGCKNFDARWWVRRAFWAQRPWLLGVDWRFVVASKLPRGDNDRVSLHYEVTRFGDIELVRGSEIPPTQAYTPLLWWVTAASHYAQQPDAPSFFGLSADSVLVSLPHLAIRLSSIHRAPSRVNRRFTYAGDFRWGAWDDAAVLPWSCVAASFKVGQASWCSHRRRLVGDCPTPLDALTRESFERVESLHRSSRTCSSSSSNTFLAASPELQILSAPLLLRVAGMLRMDGQRLEVMPPPQLWERSTSFHQSAAGRTPFHPALLAASALARAVSNASSNRLRVLYLRLRTGRERHTIAWGSNSSRVAEGRFLLVRRVDDSLKAEAATWRLQLWHVLTRQPRFRCPRRCCSEWGSPDALPIECCE